GQYGGQVGAWLEAHNDDPEAEADVEVVKKLATQIADIWRAKKHREAGTEPYKMPVRLAVLASKIGQEAAFNCKSGKDRTSERDNEAKLPAVKIEAAGGGPEPAPLIPPGEQKNRLEMALGSGSTELQPLNTGYRGEKLSGVPAVDKSFGDKV